MKFNKKIFIVLSIILLFIMLFLLANFEDNTHFYQKVISQGDLCVTVSIDCSSILSNLPVLDESLQGTAYVPEDGTILPPSDVYITAGDSVLDALKIVTKENKIQLEYTQSPNDSYVEGINYIYEFSCGELSGWMYKVNGTFAPKGCNSYIPEDGDIIEWIYTCNLGKDVGEDL